MRRYLGTQDLFHQRAHYGWSIQPGQWTSTNKHANVCIQSFDGRYVCMVIIPFAFEAFKDGKLNKGCCINSVVPAAIGILATTFPPGPAKSRAFACFGAGAPIGNAV